MRKLAVIFLFSIFVLTLPAGARSQGAAAPSLPEGKGRELVATRCVGCHDLHTAVSRRASAAEWRSTVATMVERGAQIAGADAAVIVAYLAEHYGPAGSAAVARRQLSPTAPARTC